MDGWIDRQIIRQALSHLVRHAFSASGAGRLSDVGHPGP